MTDGGEIKTHCSIPSDLLDDIASRFLLDASEAVLNEPISLCFKTEQAYWFYLDEYVQEDKSLKTLKLDTFAIHLLQHVKIEPPNGGTLENMLHEFREFKQKVPTYGGIMLNEELTSVLLVQGYTPKDFWGFPKGKINVGELPYKCAIREVLEETGYDITELIDRTVFLEATVGERLERLYIIEGVPMDVKFSPRTKGEIKELKWFNLNQLPTSKADRHVGGYIKMIFMALPFVKPLREWVTKKLCAKITPNSSKKTKRRKRHRSLNTNMPLLETQSRNGLQVTKTDVTKKAATSEKTKPNLEVVSQQLSDNLLEDSSGKFSFKKKTNKTQSETTPLRQNNGHITELFRCKAWKNFKINEKAVYKVLDEILKTVN